MTFAKVVKTSVNVNNNSSFQNCNNPHNYIQQTTVTIQQNSEGYLQQFSKPEMKCVGLILVNSALWSGEKEIQMCSKVSA